MQPSEAKYKIVVYCTDEDRDFWDWYAYELYEKKTIPVDEIRIGYGFKVKTKARAVEEAQRVINKNKEEETERLAKEELRKLTEEEFYVA